jgi:hypothetical protein
MAYQINMVTNERPNGFVLGPKGRYARPYIYKTREEAEMAITHVKEGMCMAGYDVEFGIVYDIVDEGSASMLIKQRRK